MIRYFLLVLFFQNAFAAFEVDIVDSQKYAQEVLSIKNQIIAEIKCVGSAETICDKVEQLRGRPFSLSLARQIVNWFQETGGDARIEVLATPKGNGIILTVAITERPKINKVIIEGAKNFSESNLLALLEIKDGSEIDAVAVEGSAQKLIVHYSSQGYTQVKIKPEMDSDKNLHFIIEEGPPSYVSSVEISPIEVVEDNSLRRRLEVDLEENFGIKIGERLVQDKVNDGLLSVRNWLRSHDFLTAKDPTVSFINEGQGKVRVRLGINFGSRIKFGFRKNQRFSHRELLEMISEVKEVNVGVDYIDSVKRRILESYKDVGLINAKINTIVREDQGRGIRYVSLIIDEGARVKLSAVKVEGIYSLAEDEIQKLFFAFSPRLLQRGFYQENGVQRAGELLAEHLRSKGFLSAKMEFSRVDFNEDRSSAKVFLLFNEGVQAYLKSVNLEGFSNISQSEASEKLGLKLDEPFNVFAFEKGLLALKEKYQDLGHLTMSIENEGLEDFVKFSRDQTEVYINVKVIEGPPVKLGSIIVRGNAKTHTKVITRELPVIAGDILTRPILKESEDNIRKLNLFASVIVRPIEHPGAEDERDLLILVEEAIPGAIEFTPGFRNDLGLRAALGVSYQNLGGWHRGASAKAIVNRRLEAYRFPEYNISFGFREPYFANWPVTFTANLNFLRRQFNHFGANISRITSGFRRDLTKDLAAVIEHSYERSSIFNVSDPYDQSDEGTKFIGAMIPGLIWDSRNDKFNPASGLYSSVHFELANRSFGSQKNIGYYKITNNNSTYLPIFEDLTAAFAVNFGFERSNISGQEIPILKLFRLGGMGSVRGYGEDSIEVETKKNISGTLALINYRSELRFPFYGPFGGALFFDAGNLYVDNFIPFLVRTSAGAGLRYNTPVGPVVLDVAKKLQSDDFIGDTKVSGDDRYRVHFAIGAF